MFPRRWPQLPTILCILLLQFAHFPALAVIPGLEWKAEVKAAEGPGLAVVLPKHPQESTITAADQLAEMGIQRGSLAIWEYDPYVCSPAIAAGTLSELGRWDAVIATALDLAQLPDRDRLRLPVVSTIDVDAASDILRAATATSIDEFTTPPMLVRSAGTGTILHFSVEDLPRSRIDRWTRQYVVQAMHRLGMVETDTFPTGLLKQGEVAFALYDCEGVGGSGPFRLEKIISAEPLGATVTYVSPEDIREGALTGFNGVLFPGGSGKSIAMALGAEGQEIVRDFVNQGGGYVGVCAGAYLATCRIDGYLRMVGAYHNQPWRKGGAELEVELTPEGERIFGPEFRHFITRYNNGPIFGHEEGHVPEGDFEPITVLARFRTAATNPQTEDPSTEMIDAAAITSSNYGLGRILLISPHPETHEELNPLVGRALLWSIGKLDEGSEYPEKEI